MSEEKAMTDAQPTAQSVRDVVTRALASLPVDAPHGALVNEVSAAVMAGGEVPADLMDRIIEDQARTQAATQARAILQEVLARVNAMVKSAEEQQVPERLKALDGRVHEIQAEIAGLVSTLGGIRSGDAAMRGNDSQVAAWRQLLTLAGDYADVRLRQANLAALPSGRRLMVNAEVLAKYGIMRNVDEVWPGRAAVTAGKTALPAPWPHPAGRPWSISHGVDFLLWAVSAGAELWVPTPEQLEAAHQESARATDLARSENAPKRTELAAPAW